MFNLLFFALPAVVVFICMAVYPFLLNSLKNIVRKITGINAPKKAAPGTGSPSQQRKSKSKRALQGA